MKTNLVHSKEEIDQMFLHRRDLNWRNQTNDNHLLDSLQLIKFCLRNVLEDSTSKIALFSKVELMFVLFYAQRIPLRMKRN